MWFQDNFIEMIALQTDHGASSPKTGKIKTCSYFYVPLKALKVIKLEVVNIIVTIMRWRKDKCSMFQIFQPDKLQLVLVPKFNFLEKWLTQNSTHPKFQWMAGGCLTAKFFSLFCPKDFFPSDFSPPDFFRPLFLK